VRKPSKPRPFAVTPCRTCATEQRFAPHVYCEHRRVLQAWFRDHPVLVLNTSRERATAILKRFRAFVREHEARDLVR
jgi:hypothetical protein